MRLKKKRFRKSLKTSPPLSSSKSGAENCCVVTRPVASGRVEKKLTPSSWTARRLTSAIAHLEHHLLALGAARQLQHVDHAGLARHPIGDLAGAQHDGVARHAAGEDDALVVHRDADVLAREELLERLLKRRHAGIDHDVGTDGAGLRPTRSGSPFRRSCRRSALRAAGRRPHRRPPGSSRRCA